MVAVRLNSLLAASRLLMYCLWYPQPVHNFSLFFTAFPHPTHGSVAPQGKPGPAKGVGRPGAFSPVFSLHKKKIHPSSPLTLLPLPLLVTITLWKVFVYVVFFRMVLMTSEHWDQLPKKLEIKQICWIHNSNWSKFPCLLPVRVVFIWF